MDKIGVYLHPLMHLNNEELWDEIEDENTAHEMKAPDGKYTLSRYHSCPQLCEESKVLSLSFETTTDDAGDLAAFNRRKFSLHTGRLQTYEPDSPSSSTPTPPSSPPSVRNSRSSAQGSSQTPTEGQSNVSSPVHGAGFADSKCHFNLHGHFQEDNSISSSESENEIKEWDALNSSCCIMKTISDVKIHEEERGKFVKQERKYSKVKFNGTNEKSHLTGTADKCSKWLQSVKMSQPEKIKSRSHVQIPPS